MSWGKCWFALFALLAVLTGLMDPVAAPAQTAAALTGKVASTQEPVMEGVLVSARRDGSNITTTVVTDAQGIYRFPAGRLAAGHYALSIRAGGYTLQGPQSVDIAIGKTANADLTLRKTNALANQLSNGEWLDSLPGDDRIKANLTDCVGCHSLQRIVQSTHSAAEFVQIFQRMGTYSPGSTPLEPQKLLPGPRGNRAPIPPSRQKAVADYLASVNLSEADALGYPLKTFARLKGRSTRVIITEYDLPRKDAQPHDVAMAADGTVWYSDFSHQYLGELDPATGKVTDYATPVLKPDEPKGALDLEFDPQGNIWLAMMYQAGIEKFDRKTKKITAYPFPKEWQSATANASMVSPQHSDVDGKVWTNNQEMHASYRMDAKTGQYENLGISKDANGKQVSGYGMPTDLENNLYLLQFGGSQIGRRDAKTGAVTIWQTPLPVSRPRRGRVDADNMLWFAEYGANAIGRFDPESGKIKEWLLPTPWDDPYDVVEAKDGEIWTGSMLTDRVVRLDPKTDDIVEYQLPRSTNIRRVFVDDRGPRPVLWVGSNLGASIVKVEPLD